MEVTENPHHLDPYEIHQENMQRLKVLTTVSNSSRSAPNSPMLRRATANDKLEGKKSNLLSPMLPRKNAQISEESRSRSLTHLSKSDGTRSRSISPSLKNLSPNESPIGSPMTVSDRIIRTHFLSNTTGKPGSYLLKKSDDIVKQKGSPTGSPQMLASPSLERRYLSPNIPRKLPPLNNEGSNKLSIQVKPPATIVISPATEESNNMIANPNIKNVEQVQTTTISKKENKKSALTAKQNEDLSSIKANRQFANEDDSGPPPISDIRKSIGETLLKPKVSNETTETKKIPSTKAKILKENGPSKTISNSKTKESESKQRKHRYIKYGNTNKSPGFLSPPTEPRGSKDLSAAMENIYKGRDRRVFEDLEHLEEVSVGTSDEDHGEHLSISAEELRESSAGGVPQVFTMPPVFDNIPKQLQVRDYSIPMSLEDMALTEEEWENMKQCRYLRVGENAEEDEEEEELTFSDDDEESEEEEQMIS
uniref:eukaryotic translation initiation factor 5B-like n=1 Tax=Styela clava TaxID=7725 RepID=UPI00193A8D2A|nr:eukaryotic translation initiation factor 5B-like [Styela clava]